MADKKAHSESDESDESDKELNALDLLMIRRLQSVICYRCNKPGHYAKMCPVAQTSVRHPTKGRLPQREYTSSNHRPSKYTRATTEDSDDRRDTLHLALLLNRCESHYDYSDSDSEDSIPRSRCMFYHSDDSDSEDSGIGHCERHPSHRRKFNLILRFEVTAEIL